MTNAYPISRRRRPAKQSVQIDWSRRVVEIREKSGLTQRDFAAMIGVSSKTLENWEQGRRQPTGPAGVLLTVLERDMEAVMRAQR